MQKHIKKSLHNIKLNYKLILYILALLVLYGTMAPVSDLGIQLDIPFKEYIDKIVHVLMFMALGVFIYPSYPKINPWMLTGILVLYGISIEIMQNYLPTGRSFELADWVADIFGIILGYLIYNTLKSRFLK
ncbi:MAG: VanZ family protein [Weeksellaceae bacterium]